MSTEGQPDLWVKFRDCTCPGTPHDDRDGADDGDIVYLRQSLGFAAGAEALRKWGEAIVIVAETGGGEDGTEPILDDSRASELVGPVYIREGVTGWNVVDEKGPVPLDRDLLLSDYTLAFPIAEAAGNLYTGVVLAPLLKRMNVSSRNGRNGDSTRRTRRSSEKARSPRKPSSRNGSVGPPSVTVP